MYAGVRERRVVASGGVVLGGGVVEVGRRFVEGECGSVERCRRRWSGFDTLWGGGFG